MKAAIETLEVNLTKMESDVLDARSNVEREEAALARANAWLRRSEMRAAQVREGIKELKDIERLMLAAPPAQPDVTELVPVHVEDDGA